MDLSSNEERTVTAFFYFTSSKPASKEEHMAEKNNPWERMVLKWAEGNATRSILVSGEQMGKGLGGGRIEVKLHPKVKDVKCSP